MSLEQALQKLRLAEADWHDALAAHVTAPPDAGFATRLRDYARSCERQRDALVYAADEGLEWNPLEPGSPRPRPYELSAGSGRVGPAELWAEFDAAYEAWDRSLEGRSMRAIADGFGALALIAERLAVAVDAIRLGTVAEPTRQVG